MKNLKTVSGVIFLESVLQKLETIRSNQITAKLKNKLHLIIRAATPVVGAVLLNLLLREAIHAQGGGGPVFSGSSNNLANIVREGLKLFAVLLFCGGALGVGAAIWNKMWGKEWSNYAIGGGAAFAFGTIIAVIYSISQGQAVTVDTNF